MCPPLLAKQYFPRQRRRAFTDWATRNLPQKSSTVLSEPHFGNPKSKIPGSAPVPESFSQEYKSETVIHVIVKRKSRTIFFFASLIDHGNDGHFFIADKSCFVLLNFDREIVSFCFNISAFYMILSDLKGKLNTYEF